MKKPLSKQWKYAILLVALAQIVIVIGLLALPPLVRALPGELRVRLAQVPLGDVLLDVGVTPMPTALPVPVNAVGQTRITIPALATAAIIPEETAVPTRPMVTADAEKTDALATSAAATLTETPLPTSTPTAVPLPRQVRIEGVDIIAQGFNNCGPANLTINLNFYGNPTTQAEAAAFLKPNREDRNVSPWQMVDYVNERTDLRAFIASGGDLNLLKRLLAAGFPVVIEKGYELPREGWLGHYLTIFGYDDDTREMVSMDTNLGPWDGSGRYDSYEDIEKYWQQFNYTFFVVYPPEKEQQVYDILGLEMLDTATMWQRAAEKTQAEIDADPENAFAWFNLGSSLTELGRLADEPAPYNAQATAAFDQARTLGLPFRMLWYQFTPYEAYLGAGRLEDVLALAEATMSTEGGQTIEETYLYQGRVWEQQGNVEAARAAYSRAISLNPRFAAAAAALAALNGGGGSGE